jgi:hypothetical protein
VLDDVFPVARCARCERTVLATLGDDPHDDERRYCAICDAELDPAELQWVTESALDALGWVSWTEAETCGRPDCGGGRCGK